MEPQTFEEKIKTLKTKYMRSHPDAIEQIARWEEDFIRLQAKQEWLNHPNTIELAEIVRDHILALNRLILSEAVDDKKRNEYFSLRRAHLVILAVLSEDPQSLMKSIEMSVDSELKTEQYE